MTHTMHSATQHSLQASRLQGDQLQGDRRGFLSEAECQHIIDRLTQFAVGGGRYDGDCCQHVDG